MCLCVDTLSSLFDQVREALLSVSFSSLSSHIHVFSLPSYVSSRSLFFLLYLLFFHPLSVSYFHLVSHAFLPVQRRKMIQTMEMSTYQLLVAISSRLPQSQIRPQIKYKTETPCLLHLDADSFAWDSESLLAWLQQRPLFHVHIEIYEVPAHDKSWVIDFNRYTFWNTDQCYNTHTHKHMASILQVPLHSTTYTWIP